MIAFDPDPKKSNHPLEAHYNKSNKMILRLRRCSRSSATCPANLSRRTGTAGTCDACGRFCGDASETVRAGCSAHGTGLQVHKWRASVFPGGSGSSEIYRINVIVLHAFCFSVWKDPNVRRLFKRAGKLRSQFITQQLDVEELDAEEEFYEHDDWPATCATTPPQRVSAPTPRTKEAEPEKAPEPSKAEDAKAKLLDEPAKSDEKSCEPCRRKSTSSVARASQVRRQP